MRSSASTRRVRTSGALWVFDCFLSSHARVAVPLGAHLGRGFGWVRLLTSP